MAATSRSLQRGFVKAYAAVGPPCLSTLVARVEEILSGEGSRRSGFTESSCSHPSPFAASEAVHPTISENEILKPSHYNFVRIPKRLKLRSEETRRADLVRQHDRLKGNGSLGVALQGNPVTLGVRFISAVASEHDGIVVEEEKSGSKSDEKNDQMSGPPEPEEDSLYTSAEGPVHFTAADINRYYTLSAEDVKTYFGEGLPPGLMKEFEETRERSFLIRARVLELFDRFKRCQVDTLQENELGGRVRSPDSKHKPQCLVNGFVKSGKSAALAMLVLWARMQGWLVFYVPCGRDWISGGMYYKNEQTGLYDTPVQAKIALEGFLKSHGTLLVTLPCRVMKPIQLGEGAGVGKLRGSQELLLPEGATLRDLVEKGIAVSQSAVSVVMRFNSWFTFSHFHEATGARSRRSVHARELSMVSAFRTMEGPLMMATAFSGSLAVGKIPVQLPGIPKNVRFSIPRYDLQEAIVAMKYYHRKKISFKEPSIEDIKKLFLLTNGNGEEMRTLARLLG